MGLDISAMSCIKYRPKYVWDIGTVPWTYRWKPEAYVPAVSQCSVFHDGLPGRSSTKIQRTLRGVCLHAQLFGRAKNSCKGLTNEHFQKDDAPAVICLILYRRDPMSVVPGLYNDLRDFINPRRNCFESSTSFKSLFLAQISKYNSHGSSGSLLESLYGLLLLANAGVDDSQSGPVLSAATNAHASAVMSTACSTS